MWECWIDVSVYPEGLATYRIDKEFCVFFRIRANSEMVSKVQVFMTNLPT
jgi:hypothetical protein